MLNIRWSKNETGRLLAVWVLREPGKPGVPLGTDRYFPLPVVTLDSIGSIAAACV